MAAGFDIGQLTITYKRTHLWTFHSMLWEELETVAEKTEVSPVC